MYSLYSFSFNLFLKKTFYSRYTLDTILNINKQFIYLLKC